MEEEFGGGCTGGGVALGFEVGIEGEFEREVEAWSGC